MELFEIQPDWCRKKIDITNSVTPLFSMRTYQRKVFEFDPAEMYERINFLNVAKPYERHHSIGVKILFPQNDNLCSCGCGQVLQGRRTRWASDECRLFSDVVFCIIAGYRDTIANYVGLIKGFKCAVCNSSYCCELDHIYPIKFGGGNSWLSNYEFKCKKCHREKTNKDFGFGLEKPKIVLKVENQIELF